jgi:hypothetical protein
MVVVLHNGKLPAPPVQGCVDSRSLATYRFNVDGPPHVSEELPVQGMLQDVLLSGNVPFPKTTPQKHCDPYSTPAKEYPPSLQAKRHSSTVRLVELSWFCWYIKARPFVPSE